MKFEIHFRLTRVVWKGAKTEMFVLTLART